MSHVLQSVLNGGKVSVADRIKQFENLAIVQTIANDLCSHSSRPDGQIYNVPGPRIALCIGPMFAQKTRWLANRLSAPLLNTHFEQLCGLRDWKRDVQISCSYPSSPCCRYYPVNKLNSIFSSNDGSYSIRASNYRPICIRFDDGRLEERDNVFGNVKVLRVKHLDHTLVQLLSSYTHVGIDEAQFFPSKSSEALNTLSLSHFVHCLAFGTDAISIAGLSASFMQEPFPAIQSLLPLVTEDIKVMTAVCVGCYQPATMTVTTRFCPDTSNVLTVSEKPHFDANYVGSAESYQPVCRVCARNPTYNSNWKHLIKDNNHAM